MNKKISIAFRRALAASLIFGVCSIPVSAQIDLYVLQIGDGTGISGDFRPLTILQYSGTANSQTLTNSWAAPSTDPTNRITMAPSFTTYGYMNLSHDGSHLVFAGRDVEVGQAQGTATRTVIGTFNLQIGIGPALAGRPPHTTTRTGP